VQRKDIDLKYSRLQLFHICRVSARLKNQGYHTLVAQDAHSRLFIEREQRTNSYKLTDKKAAIQDTVLALNKHEHSTDVRLPYFSPHFF